MITRYIVACMLASTVFQIALVAQSDLPPLPADTQVVVHINNTAGLVNELEHFRSLASERRFQKILFDEPYPLLQHDQWDQLLESLDQLVDLLEQTRSVTLFATSLESKAEYGIWWKLEDPSFANEVLKSLTTLRHHSPLWNSYKPDLNDVAAKAPDSDKTHQPSTFDLGTELAVLLAALAPTHIDFGEHSITVSNSRRLADWMSESVEPPSGNTLATSRRFKRATAGLGKKPFDAMVFLVPEFVLPIWDSKMDAEYLNKFGYEEMVGAAAGLRFVDPLEHPDRAIARMSLSVPFTAPAKGIIRNWQCYSPIETVPELSGFLNALRNEKPKLLRVISRNRAESFRVNEEIYRQNDELEEWHKRLAPYVEYAGSEQNFRDYYSGDEVILRLTADQPVHHNYLFHLQRIKDEQVTRSYLGHYLSYFNRDNQTPKKLMQLSNHDSWFQSDENALRQAESDFGRGVDESQRHLIRNTGYSIAGDWLIQSDKSIVELFYENSTARDRKVARELDKCFSGAAEIVSEYSPSWMEFRFPRSRLEEAVQRLRMRYFLTHMDQEEARRLVIGWGESVSPLETISIKSRSDRLFAVSDWLVCKFFERYERDARFFSCESQHFEWHWHFFGSGNPGDNQ